MLLLKWVPEAWSEYVLLQDTDRKLLKKTNKLINELLRNGYHCEISTFEFLKHDFSGYASVRIDRKNRIVFTVADNTLVIIQCGGHYHDK
ncbi:MULTISPECIES: Txe/YoeB family addiction module toxin [Caproicibacterium]|uniref:Endoribonuclease YoeB n=1 Tax=Caproicibacterium argilliputei TaxID=3030016 RepID=A0AA97D8W4_9FIRM|nr:Txe/YoeB family addiction module toxin [Caproicibacterium argilliputei]WOC32381.1 Txe/YoeB family addiction module toxin [Caproicibacterium argilliputei]